MTNRLTIKEPMYGFFSKLRGRTVEVELIDNPRYAEGSRYYNVYLDGDLVGTVFKSETTWERRSRGSRIVSARGTTPAWFVQNERGRMSYDSRASAAFTCAEDSLSKDD